MTAAAERQEAIARIEPADAIDITEPTEPIEATDKADPFDPIESRELLEAIESTEPCDQSDHLESRVAASESGVSASRVAPAFMQTEVTPRMLATTDTAGRSGSSLPPRVVVMGVSGSGKTVVGGATAVLLSVPFLDADGLHPARNTAKMAAGIPLTAEDREPWLKLVGANIAAARAGIVVACSALRRSYRDTIRAAGPDAYFVHLAADPALIAGRLERRQGHFMPASLLGSQLETLEPLEPDEAGLTLVADAPVGELAERILETVRAR
jgi:carbohydrate kinase (thermoresistant glucokinase family)